MVEQRRDSENKDDGHNDKFVLIPGILDDAFENDLPHEPAKDKNYSVHSRIELIEIDCEIGVNTNDVGQKCTAAEGAYGEPRLHHDNRQSIIQIMDNIVTSSDREEERPVSSEQIIAQNQKSGSAVLHDEEYEQSNSVDTRVDADVQGYISRFQVFIEDAFRMHISWWPLPAPQRETMGKAGWKQIWWKCVRPLCQVTALQCLIFRRNVATSSLSGSLQLRPQLQLQLRLQPARTITRLPFPAPLG